MTSQQEEEDLAHDREKGVLNSNKRKIDVKKLIIGAGARVLFYPTLVYNVLRFNIDSDFRWWDQIDQYLFLGAVPFPKDVPRLKQLGVGGVITLNEPFETLVPPSMYKAHGMEHLIIPTRDYLYAPSFDDINRAIDFIHNNASCGRATYVHCKAGRGRSTTIALCYLVKYKQMTPSTAMDLIRAKRPRVLLTSMQAKAVEQFYQSCSPVSSGHSSYKSCSPVSSGHSSSSDEVLITQADIAGYNKSAPVPSSDQKRLRIRPVTRLSSFLSSLATPCSSLSISSQQPKKRAC